MAFLRDLVLFSTEALVFKKGHTDYTQDNVHKVFEIHFKISLCEVLKECIDIKLI